MPSNHPNRLKLGFARLGGWSLPCSIATLLLAGSVLAQTTTRRSAPPSTPAPRSGPSQQAPSRLALATDAPFEIPSLGLSIYLPEESGVDMSRLEGGRTTVIIRPLGADQTWVFQVHNSISSDRTLTLGTAVDNIVSQRQSLRVLRDRQGNTVSQVRAFDRVDNLVAAQHPAQRVYLDVPADPSVPVSGYTLFHTGPGQFVIFQMDCAAPIFPKVRELYEMLVASAQFRDPDELNSDRAAALLAGEALLKRLEPADFDAVMDDAPRFLRVYTPAPSGAAGDAAEVAYQRVQARKGQAGELDPEKKKTSWKGADKEEGWLLRIEARSLAQDSVVDTVSSFFLSRDRRRELWSILMVVRRGKDREAWTETGIRRDDNLTVKTARTGAEPTSVDWSPLPKAYLSRVECLLLPRLVARKDIPGIFGFYTYESALAKMTLRRETCSKETTGAWTISSQQSENSQPLAGTYDASGWLIRRVAADGTIVEPSDLARLRRIWADKKLPLD